MGQRRQWVINWRAEYYMVVRRQDLQPGEAERASSPREAARSVGEWGQRFRVTLREIATAVSGFHGGDSAGRVAGAFTRGDIVALKVGRAKIVDVGADKANAAALGPVPAPPVAYHLWLNDCAGTNLDGIEVVFTIDGKKYPAKTDGSGHAEVRDVHGGNATVVPKDPKALFEGLTKKWDKPLHALPMGPPLGVEDFPAVSIAPDQHVTVTLSPYDLLVRMPVVPGVDPAKLPHVFHLESKDGSIKQSHKASEGKVVMLFYVELWFTHLRHAQSYRLTCTGGPEPASLFDFTPYAELAKSGTKAAPPAKLPLAFYYPE